MGFLCLALASTHPRTPGAWVRPGRAQSTASSSRAASPSSASDLVLITISSLRSDRVGSQPATSLTPRLTGAGNDARLLLHGWSPSPSTLPAAASVLTGLDARRHGILSPDSPGSGLTTLAGILRRSGFRTYAALSDPSLAAAPALLSDFDQVLAEPRLPAPELARRALRLAGGAPAGQRLFLWVHFSDPSAPYTAPLVDLLEVAASARNAVWNLPLRLGATEDAPEALPPSVANGPMRKASFYIDCYDTAIRLADHGVDEIWRGARRLRSPDGLLMVVASLHGEALGEHGFWFSHGHTLFQEEISIPILFSGPGIRPGRDEETPSSLLDVMPTALALLGLPIRPGDFDGVNLSPRLRGQAPPLERLLYAAQVQAPYSRAMLARGRMKLILTPPRPSGLSEPVSWATTQTRQLFDIAGDPRETKPLEGLRQGIAHELTLWLEDKYPPIPGTPPASDYSWRR